MATEITLYVGEDAMLAKYTFTDQSIWQGVRSQIEAAMKAGYGLITIPRPKGGSAVHVYNRSLRIHWIDTSA